jgi:hypothetical protein
MPGMEREMLNRSKIDRVVRKNWGKLRKKGVLAVRPGYAFTGGWITNQPAAVAIVDKKGKVAPKDMLPSKIDDVHVDVQEATPLERLRHTDPTQYAHVSTARPEYYVPAAPFERTMNKSGAPPAPVPRHSAVTPKKGGKKPAKAAINYSTAPPPLPPKTMLNPVAGKMTITCHASPDAGWPELQGFLAGTKDKLTVGLYDFTSAHILDAFVQSMRGSKRLSMVLDHPGDNQTADQSDEQTRADILKSMGTRAAIDWALSGEDPLVKGKAFPSAYHIKVAVRDSSVFWLSSGNWNNSNQPAIDPTKVLNAQVTAIAKKSDRDWHVIVENTELARAFEAFLSRDFQMAQAQQLPSPVPPTGLKKKKQNQNIEAGLDRRVPPVAPSQYFKPETITDEMTIEPLLTPDNYGPNMLSLIQSAKKSIYIQTQYIRTPKNDPKGVLMTLLAAVRDQIEAGLDVRIIVSEFEQASGLDALKDAGIDTSLIKVQNGVHNKGFVIDSAVVALGSQNWSDQGAATNRDATVIIRHAGAAQYYEQIFIHDWTKMAKQHLVG